MADVGKTLADRFYIERAAQKRIRKRVIAVTTGRALPPIPEDERLFALNFVHMVRAARREQG